MTFKDFEDDLQTAFKFYDIYRDGGTWLLEPSSPEPLLGSSISPRTCRFCRKKAPHANFRRQAHAVPELLGNKSLLVAYECGTCNSKFGSSYEHQLGAWTKPIRTLSRIRGKKGVPSLEKSGSFKIVDTPNGLHFTEYADSPDLELNRDAKQWIMTLPRDPHVPLKVLKAFVRIALNLLPEDQVSLFRETIDWINDVGGTQAMYFKQGFAWQFQPGPPETNKMLVTLLLRKSDYATSPYCILFIAAGSFEYQVIIPCKQKDWYLKNKKIVIPFFPSFHPAQANTYGLPQRYMGDFSSSQIDRDAKIRFVMAFSDIREV